MATRGTLAIFFGTTPTGWARSACERNSGGTATEWCSDIPYGMNLTCTNPTDPSPMHFTGKQRDYESGLGLFRRALFRRGQ